MEKNVQVSFAEIMNIPVTELLKSNTKVIDIPYQIEMTREIDHQLYYVKEINSILEVLNELIGNELASFLGLDSSTKIFGKSNYEWFSQVNQSYYIMSPNVKKENCEYTDTNESLRTMFLPMFLCYDSISYLETLETLPLPLPQRLELKEQLLKLFAIDIYMYQQDRFGNVIIEKQNNHYQLAPIYDFEYAFLNCSKDHLSLSISMTDIQVLKKKYPAIEYYLKTLYQLEPLALLKKVEEKYQIRIPDIVKEYYQERMNMEKEMITTDQSFVKEKSLRF